MALDAPDFEDWFTGLLPTLEGVDARTASQRPGPDRSSIGAHVRHIAYAMTAANAWFAGEQPVLDWEAAWRQPSVTDTDWRALLETIAHERRVLETQINSRAELDAKFLTGAIKSLAHLGYHVGAIRQIRVQVRP